MRSLASISELNGTHRRCYTTCDYEFPAGMETYEVGSPLGIALYDHLVATFRGGDGFWQKWADGKSCRVSSGVPVNFLHSGPVLTWVSEDPLTDGSVPNVPPLLVNNSHDILSCYPFGPRHHPP